MLKMQDRVKSYKLSDAEIENMNKTPTSNKYYDDNTRCYNDKIQDY